MGSLLVRFSHFSRPETPENGAFLIHATCPAEVELNELPSSRPIPASSGPQKWLKSTAPEARGSRYHPILLYRAAEYAKERGREYCYAFIESDNIVWLRTHLRFGFEVMGEMIYTRPGPLHGCWRKPYDPRGRPSWWGFWWHLAPYGSAAARRWFVAREKGDAYRYHGRLGGSRSS